MEELTIAHFYLTDRSKQMPVDARVVEHGKENWQTDPKFVYRCVRPDGTESLAKYSIERWYRASQRYRPLLDAFTQRYATNVNGWRVIDPIWARACVRAWQSGECR